MMVEDRPLGQVRATAITQIPYTEIGITPYSPRITTPTPTASSPPAYTPPTYYSPTPTPARVVSPTPTRYVTPTYRPSKSQIIEQAVDYALQSQRMSQRVSGRTTIEYNRYEYIVDIASRRAYSLGSAYNVVVSKTEIRAELLDRNYLRGTRPSVTPTVPSPTPTPVYYTPPAYTPPYSPTPTPTRVYTPPAYTPPTYYSPTPTRVVAPTIVYSPPVRTPTATPTPTAVVLPAAPSKSDIIDQAVDYALSRLGLARRASTLTKLTSRTYDDVGSLALQRANSLGQQWNIRVTSSEIITELRSRGYIRETPTVVSPTPTAYTLPAYTPAPTPTPTRVVAPETIPFSPPVRTPTVTPAPTAVIPPAAPSKSDIIEQAVDYALSRFGLARRASTLTKIPSATYDAVGSAALGRANQLGQQWNIRVTSSEIITELRFRGYIREVPKAAEPTPVRVVAPETAVYTPPVRTPVVTPVEETPTRLVAPEYLRYVAPALPTPTPALPPAHTPVPTPTPARMSLEEWASRAPIFSNYADCREHALAVTGQTPDRWRHCITYEDAIIEGVSHALQDEGITMFPGRRTGIPPGQYQRVANNALQIARAIISQRTYNPTVGGRRLGRIGRLSGFGFFKILSGLFGSGKRR